MVRMAIKSNSKKMKVKKGYRNLGLIIFFVILFILVVFIVRDSPEQVAQKLSVSLQQKDFATMYNLFVPELTEMKSKEDFVISAQMFFSENNMNLIYDKTIKQDSGNAYAYYTISSGIYETQVPPLSLKNTLFGWKVNGFSNLFIEKNIGSKLILTLKDLPEGWIISESGPVSREETDFEQRMQGWLQQYFITFISESNPSQSIEHLVSIYESGGAQERLNSINFENEKYDLEKYDLLEQDTFGDGSKLYYYEGPEFNDYELYFVEDYYYISLFIYGKNLDLKLFKEIARKAEQKFE